jgi:hypothetical protein
MARRGYVAILLGAAGLLVAGLSVTRVVLAFDDGTVVEPISADAAYAIDGPLTCDSKLQEVPTLPLEAEPVALLLCADPDGSSPWTSPADVVEGDLAELRAVLDDLEPTPDEDYACTMQGGPAYDLFLRFSRDRYARIHGETGGCGVVTTGIGEWFGANEVLDTALALVEEQRDRQPEPTAVPDAPGCPVYSNLGPAYSLTGEVAEMVVAVSCWRPDAPEPPPFGDAVPVPARQLRVLLADVEQNSEPLEKTGDYDCPGGLDELYSQVLVGRTAWGDLLALSGACREFYVDVWSQRPGDDPARVWRPTPRSQRILDSLRR